MTKKLVTTSIEERIYDEFCQSIGRKKINQVLQDYMASVVSERKKARARN